MLRYCAGWLDARIEKKESWKDLEEAFAQRWDRLEKIVLVVLMRCRDVKEIGVIKPCILVMENIFLFLR